MSPASFPSFSFSFSFFSFDDSFFSLEEDDSFLDSFFASSLGSLVDSFLDSFFSLDDSFFSFFVSLIGSSSFTLASDGSLDSSFFSFSREENKKYVNFLTYDLISLLLYSKTLHSSHSVSGLSQSDAEVESDKGSLGRAVEACCHRDPSVREG